MGISIYILCVCLCVRAGKLPHDAAGVSERRAGGQPTAARKLKGNAAKAF